QAKMRSLSEKRSETRKISHNPEVSGSNPLPATVKRRESAVFHCAHDSIKLCALLSRPYPVS
ncbi:MAG: hypothetical protein LLG42_00390, partial [Chloroflexi bacterium]|nr:hypothetical protein [Chloroflexota bacterium]